MAYMVSSHKLFMELLSDEEKKTLLDQMRRRSATVNLSAKPLPSFYDIPGVLDTGAHTTHAEKSDKSCKHKKKFCTHL